MALSLFVHRVRPRWNAPAPLSDVDPGRQGATLVQKAPVGAQRARHAAIERKGRGGRAALCGQPERQLVVGQRPVALEPPLLRQASQGHVQMTTPRTGSLGDRAGADRVGLEQERQDAARLEGAEDHPEDEAVLMQEQPSSE